MKTLKILIASSLVALSSCATLYQKEGPFTNGYSDIRAGHDTFVITFKANEYTTPEKVRKYALKRAAEVSRKHGYQYFSILDSTERDKHLRYPSLRLTIQAFHEKPTDRLSFDVHSIL